MGNHVMKNLLYVVVLLLIMMQRIQSQTQSSATPPPEYGWKHGLLTGLTLTQVAYTDWVQGGENALAYTITIDGKSAQDEAMFNWTSIYKFAFGQTRLGIQGLRKTDDIIDLGSVFTYKLGSYINPYGAVTVKTQFARGFVYDATGIGADVSKFFDPAYFTQSAGVGYQPMKEFRERLGLALREVITDKFNQYADDPATTSIEKTSVDGGLESVTNVEWQLEENMLFTSQLELFAPFKALDEVVVRNTSTITAKVNKYITAILSVQLINEKRASPRTQIKENIAMGLSYTIF
ncbi:MAG TPA: DUF3078 domain-containing protein [Bacteroidota bacterium]|nr:DUF3078 domain-containing protein [Bacteroidota bacterium]